MDLSGYTWAQMAAIVHDIHEEASRRNPIGINLYLPYLKQAEEVLTEISEGEKGNPTSECGPTESPFPFGWKPAPQWAKDAKDEDGKE